MTIAVFSRTSSSVRNPQFTIIPQKHAVINRAQLGLLSVRHYHNRHISEVTLLKGLAPYTVLLKPSAAVPMQPNGEVLTGWH